MVMTSSEIVTSAIIGLIMISGIAYTLVDKGVDRTCSTGWELVTEGIYIGQYGCDARPTVHYYCYNVRSSSKTLNYWCDEGELKIVPKEKVKDYVACNNPNYACYNNIMVRI